MPAPALVGNALYPPVCATASRPFPVSPPLCTYECAFSFLVVLGPPRSSERHMRHQVRSGVAFSATLLQAGGGRACTRPCPALPLPSSPPPTPFLSACPACACSRMCCRVRELGPWRGHPSRTTRCSDGARLLPCWDPLPVSACTLRCAPPGCADSYPYLNVIDGQLYVYYALVYPSGLNTPMRSQVR